MCSSASSCLHKGYIGQQCQTVVEIARNKRLQPHECYICCYNKDLYIPTLVLGSSQCSYKAYMSKGGYTPGWSQVGELKMLLVGVSLPGLQFLGRGVELVVLHELQEECADALLKAPHPLPGHAPAVWTSSLYTRATIRPQSR